MYPFRQASNFQRIPFDGVSSPRSMDETVYILKRPTPNIISRGSNKYRIVEIQPSDYSDEQQLLDTSVTYLEELYDPTTQCSNFPIEILNSEDLIISEQVPELSLALEPTVISQPIPHEIPITYDSTCVSQAISTPIVTPIVSSSNQPSSYLFPNNTQTFQVCLADNGLSEDISTSTVQIVNQDDGTIYLAPVSQYDENNLSMTTGHGQVSLQQQNDQQQQQQHMRIETQGDGSIVLFLHDFASSEPIQLGSDDTEIIQTDAFPVIPNQPIELPSLQSENQNNGEGTTESFILLPVDDQGNTVLVPTPSFKHKQKPKNILKKSLLKSTSTSSSIVLENGEKPKPFRYELPDDPESNFEEEENCFMTQAHLRSENKQQEIQSKNNDEKNKIEECTTDEDDEVPVINLDESSSEIVDYKPPVPAPIPVPVRVAVSKPRKSKIVTTKLRKSKSRKCKNLKK